MKTNFPYSGSLWERSTTVSTKVRHECSPPSKRVVTITYLYTHVWWEQTNTHLDCDEGPVKVYTMLLQRNPRWVYAPQCCPAKEVSVAFTTDLSGDRRCDREWNHSIVAAFVDDRHGLCGGAHTPTIEDTNKVKSCLDLPFGLS